MTCHVHLKFPYMRLFQKNKIILKIKKKKKNAIASPGNTSLYRSSYSSQYDAETRCLFVF